jgi:hypothetical protein
VKKYVISGIAGAVVLGLFWCSGMDLPKRGGDLAFCCIVVVCVMGFAFTASYDED